MFTYAGYVFRIAPHSGPVWLALSTTSHTIEEPLVVGIDGFKEVVNITVPANVPAGGDYVILRQYLSYFLSPSLRLL